MSELLLDIEKKPEHNRFREALGRGDFVLLVESVPPENESDPKTAAEHLQALDAAVSDLGIEAGLAVPDKVGYWRSVEIASAIPEENRDRHLFYLSGNGSDSRDVEELLKAAGNSGICNLAAVSGDGLPLGIRSCRARNFTESIEILRQASSHAPLFMGGVTNPFQYTPYTLMGQYYKMMKKIAAGASFLVTQAGWDMLRLQSLRWFAVNRSVCEPMIARLILLTPDKAEKIISGQCPGMKISADFRKLLDRELRYSRNQFEAAQYRRIELQAAGCRLMGFSGVQLAGVDFPGRAKILASRIMGAIEEFKSFEQWLDEYNAYLASAEMAPFFPNFRLYDRVLHRDYPADEPPVSHELPEVRPGCAERLSYRLRKFLFSGSTERRPGSLRMLKALFSGCRGCEKCRLDDLEFVCPELCPKHLANGPCGGVRADGSCEMGGAECIHIKITRLAHWRGELPKLEEYIAPGRR